MAERLFIRGIFILISIAGASVSQAAGVPSGEALTSREALMGSWVNNECLWMAAPAASPEAVGGHFVNVEYGFGETRFTQTVRFFDQQDSYCQYQPLVSSVIKGEYSLGNVLPGIQHARAIDFFPKSVDLTVFDAATVDYYNRVSYCGDSDWLVGKPKSVFGKICNFAPEGPRIYQIFGVFDVFGQRRLYLGRTTEVENARSPEARPREMDLANAFLMPPVISSSAQSATARKFTRASGGR